MMAKRGIPCHSSTPRPQIICRPLRVGELWSDCTKRILSQTSFRAAPRVPMRGFVKGVRLRRTPSLPPSHLVPIRILSRRRGVGCLLKSVFRLPLMPRTHRSECRNAVTGTGCKLTLDRRPSSTFAAFSNQNPSLHFRSFLSKSQMPSSYSRLVHHVPIRILSR